MPQGCSWTQLPPNMWQYMIITMWLLLLSALGYSIPWCQCCLFSRKCQNIFWHETKRWYVKYHDIIIVWYFMNWLKLQKNWNLQMWRGAGTTMVLSPLLHWDLYGRRKLEACWYPGARTSKKKKKKKKSLKHHSKHINTHRLGCGCKYSHQI